MHEVVDMNMEISGYAITDLVRILNVLCDAIRNLYFQLDALLPVDHDVDVVAASDGHVAGLCPIQNICNHFPGDFTQFVVIEAASDGYPSLHVRCVSNCHDFVVAHDTYRGFQSAGYDIVGG